MWRVYPKWTSLLLFSFYFYYCTVICDVLWPIDVIFWKRQHKLYLIFCISIFLKVGKFATFSERPKAKSVSASRGLCPPDQELCPWTLLGTPLPDPLL